MPVGPLELRLPGIHISAGVQTTLLSESNELTNETTDKPNGIQDIRVHAFHTHGANARLKGGNR